MKKDSRIYVVGHEGFIGSAIVRKLKKSGYNILLLKKDSELDLTDQRMTRAFFRAAAPEYVFLAAEKSGGIWANSTYLAEFIYKNLMIQTNVIDSAYRNGIKKLLFLGSSCSYPRMCPQPMKEEHLLSGYLEPTNEAYAVAKIAGIKMCQAYNKQYGTKFISVIPSNLYGINDNFDSKESHVLPALIRKFHEAKTLGVKVVTLWGSGKPKREFLYVDDFADACIFLMNNYNSNEAINVGSGRDISIARLALMIKDVAGFKEKIVYDKTKPDGMPRKLLDTTKIHNLGWRAKTDLGSGLRLAYEYFKTEFKGTKTWKKSIKKLRS
jgi:GDP-L-fucose synthase